MMRGRQKKGNRLIIEAIFALCKKPFVGLSLKRNIHGFPLDQAPERIPQRPPRLYRIDRIRMENLIDGKPSVVQENDPGPKRPADVTFGNYIDIASSHETPRRIGFARTMPLCALTGK